LTQHHTKANQVVQAADSGPGKKKGLVDSLPPGQELQADRNGALSPETIHSNLDDTVTREPAPGLELNLDRGVTLNFEKSLQASWQAKVAPETIIPETDDTPTTELPRRWQLRDGRAMLRSPSPELDDDDDNWKFVPYFGALLLFFRGSCKVVPAFSKRGVGCSGTRSRSRSSGG
jgi:hypothetical protein